MTQFKLLGSTALVALVSGSAAFADVTPEDVWQNWKDMTASYGQTVTVESEARDGDTLVVKGIQITSENEKTKADISIDELNFTDAGDGSVDVTISDENSFVVTTPAEGEGEPTEVTVNVSMPDFALKVSGSAEELRNDYTAPSLKVSLAEINGVDAEKVDLSADLTMTDMSGSGITKGATDKTSTGTFAAKSMSLNFTAKDSEKGSDFTMAGTMADLAGSMTSATAGSMDMADMAAALKAGFAMSADYTYGKGDYTFAFTEAENTANGSLTVDNGNFSVVMDKDKLGYGAGSKGAVVTVAGSQIPFPELKVSYAESAFNLLMPVSKSDTPSNFALVTKIIDLALPEEVWAMADPTGALPHDPLTVALDTKGTATLKLDIMDTAAMKANGEAAPGDLNSLDLTELTVKAAGAEIVGSGALTFDNTDTTTFQGVPAPTGIVDFKITGANGLMDKLAAMGLIPEDQLMGARMMMGMFAKMVEGQTDTMTSTVEFKDKGLFVNGQQLQ